VLRRLRLASGERRINLHSFACALSTALVVGVAVAAETPPSEDQCAKGPVSDLPETIRKKPDEQTGITWYSAPATSERVNEDAFYLYVGKKGCDVWLRLRIQYVSDKPLNVVRIVVKGDDKTFDLAEPHFKRDSDGKLVWQWLDEKVTTDHLVMLFTLTAAKNAVVQFVGASRSEERTIPQPEKDALKSMLSVYTALGGKL
jgi:hypothetical protein